RRSRAPRKLLQLEPALVVVVPGIEKRRGLRYVDKHVNAKLGALVPHRIEFGIVDVHALTAGVFHIHSEILEYFQALCAAALDVLLEPRGCPLAVPRGVKVVVTQIGKDHEAIRVRSEERRVGKECRCRWWPYH